MNCSRRTFICGPVPVATTFSFGMTALAGQQQTSGQGRAFPGLRNSSDPNLAPGDPMTVNPANARPVLEHNQPEIQQDIKKLYSLAERLKQQVEQTNSADVLSLNLVEDAKKIEDLAKANQEFGESHLAPFLSEASHYRAVTDRFVSQVQE